VWRGDGHKSPGKQRGLEKVGTGRRDEPMFSASGE
jgi:hypothetical protein